MSFFDECAALKFYALMRFFFTSFFERAAAAGNSEGLYNIGVFYANGHAGYPKNVTKAISYFELASNHSNPFPMALHAMGNYYYGLIDKVIEL